MPLRSWIFKKRGARTLVPTIEGHLDLIGPTEVSGWARQDNHPQSVVSVGLIVDGERVAECAADRFRPDLVDADHDGRHGFRLRIPEHLLDGEEHELRVVVDGTHGDYPVVGSLLETHSRKLTADLRVWRNLHQRACHAVKDRSVYLSIIMPTYNRSARMERTCRHMLKLAQDLPVEIVVVNDGSSDQTCAALQRLEADFPGRVRWATIDNSGPGQARNVGASMARGDVVLFVGDDTEPVDTNFLATHILFHAERPQANLAVLGKTRWSDHPDDPVSFVMERVQGEGQQQFGYRYMKPYHTYDWQLFYSSNVSVKRSLVSDWMADGFSSDFTLAAFEDPEFAYRMHKQIGRV